MHPQALMLAAVNNKTSLIKKAAYAAFFMVDKFYDICKRTLFTYRAHVVGRMVIVSFIQTREYSLSSNDVI